MFRAHRIGSAISFVAIVLSLGAMGADSRRAPAIRVFKIADGVPFKMGKVDARRILHPDMGARNSRWNCKSRNQDMNFPSTCTTIRMTPSLVLQGQVDVRQGDSRRPLPQGQAAFVQPARFMGRSQPARVQLF